MKTELTEIRNRLYDKMPSGEISAWELLKAVKLHLDELDEFIDKMDAQCVLSDVVGQSEQLVCQHEWIKVGIYVDEDEIEECDKCRALRWAK